MWVWTAMLYTHKEKNSSLFSKTRMNNSNWHILRTNCCTRVLAGNSLQNSETQEPKGRERERGLQNEVEAENQDSP